MKMFAFLFVLLTLRAAAQDVPAGWKVVKDRKQTCQMAVPSDWTGSAIMPSNLTSPDKKANVVFGGKPASAAYADIVKMAKSMFKPVKTSMKRGIGRGLHPRRMAESPGVPGTWR
jgi:hypothetical protein